MTRRRCHHREVDAPPDVVALRWNAPPPGWPPAEPGWFPRRAVAASDKLATTTDGPPVLDVRGGWHARSRGARCTWVRANRVGTRPDGHHPGLGTRPGGGRRPPVAVVATSGVEATSGVAGRAAWVQALAARPAGSRHAYGRVVAHDGRSRAAHAREALVALPRAQRSGRNVGADLVLRAGVPRPPVPPAEVEAGFAMPSDHGALRAARSATVQALATTARARRAWLTGGADLAIARHVATQGGVLAAQAQRTALESVDAAMKARAAAFHEHLEATAYQGLAAADVDGTYRPPSVPCPRCGQPLSRYSQRSTEHVHVQTGCVTTLSPRLQAVGVRPRPPPPSTCGRWASTTRLCRRTVSTQGSTSRRAGPWRR